MIYARNVQMKGRKLHHFMSKYVYSEQHIRDWPRHRSKILFGQRNVTSSLSSMHSFHFRYCSPTQISKCRDPFLRLFLKNSVHKMTRFLERFSYQHQTSPYISACSAFSGSCKKSAPHKTID